MRIPFSTGIPCDGVIFSRIPCDKRSFMLEWLTCGLVACFPGFSEFLSCHCLSPHNPQVNGSSPFPGTYDSVRIIPTKSVGGDPLRRIRRALAVPPKCDQFRTCVDAALLVNA